MNSLAYNDSNELNAIELEHKEISVNNSEEQLNKSKQHNIHQHKQAIYNDVCTASYVRGYN